MILRYPELIDSDTPRLTPLYFWVQSVPCQCNELVETNLQFSSDVPLSDYWKNDADYQVVGIGEKIVRTSPA